MRNFNYEKWHEEYKQKEFIEVKKYFKEKNIEVLEKLNIQIMDKLYTGYEFDLLDDELMLYYENNITKQNKKLKEKGVTVKEYNELIEKTEQILKDYNL